MTNEQAKPSAEDWEQAVEWIEREDGKGLRVTEIVTGLVKRRAAELAAAREQSAPAQEAVDPLARAEKGMRMLCATDDKTLCDAMLRNPEMTARILRMPIGYAAPQAREPVVKVSELRELVNQWTTINPGFVPLSRAVRNECADELKATCDRALQEGKT